MAIRTANNQSLTEITAVPSAVALGGMVLLETQTASSSATISFTSNIDSTYKEYIFKFMDVHAATNRALLTFNLSIDSGSNYNVTKTTTFFTALHYEDDTAGDPDVYNVGGKDLAQGTGFQTLLGNLTTDNDSSGSGYLHLFDPSSDVFVKHFISRCSALGEPAGGDDYLYNPHIAGYANTTSAVDAVQFKMDTGNIDAGTFKLYGVT